MVRAAPHAQVFSHWRKLTELTHRLVQTWYRIDELFLLDAFDMVYGAEDVGDLLDFVRLVVDRFLQPVDS